MPEYLAANFTRGHPTFAVTAKGSATTQPALCADVKTLSLFCNDRCTATAWSLRVLLIPGPLRGTHHPAQDLLLVQQLKAKAWPSRGLEIPLQTTQGACIRVRTFDGHVALTLKHWNISYEKVHLLLVLLVMSLDCPWLKGKWVVNDRWVISSLTVLVSS